LQTKIRSADYYKTVQSTATLNVQWGRWRFGAEGATFCVASSQTVSRNPFCHQKPNFHYHSSNNKFNHPKCGGWHPLFLKLK